MNEGAFLSKRNFIRKKGKNKKALIVSLVLFFFVIIMVIAALYIYFQKQQQLNILPPDNSDTEVSEEVPMPEISEIVIQSQEPEQSESSEEISVEPPVESSNTTQTTVPYFDDAMFVGDSISEGIKIYTNMTNATVLAERSVKVGSALTDTFTLPDNTQSTLLPAITKLAPKKVYLMLGTNGIGWLKVDNMLSDYSKLIDSVKQAAPNAILYIQGIPPITQSLHNSNPQYNIDKIKQYNQGLSELAQEKGAHFLDIASALADANGYLPEGTSSDGIHFGKATYQKWFDYVINHTI